MFLSANEINNILIAHQKKIRAMNLNNEQNTTARTIKNDGRDEIQAIQMSMLKYITEPINPKLTKHSKDSTPNARSNMIVSESTKPS